MKVLDLIYKDLKIFVRDRKALFLTFLLPVALITLFSLAYGGIGNKEPKPEQILISDMDSTALSQELVSKLESIPGIQWQSIDTATGKEAVKQGKRLAMLSLHTGYADSLAAGRLPLITLWFDEGRAMETGMLMEALSASIVPSLERNRTQQSIQGFLKVRYAGMGEGFAEGLSKEIGQYMETSSSSKEIIQAQGITTGRQVNWGLIQSVAGVAVMMLLFSVAAIGGSILSEKEEGTLKRLLGSPVPSSGIMLAKLGYAVIIAMAQLLVMFLFGWLVFTLDIWTNPLGLLLVVLATALACSSFGIFLAAVSRSRRQVEGMSTIVVLIMSAIGGSMIPLFFMPAFMQKLAVFSVNYWSIQAFYDILGRDADWAVFIWKAGVLIAIAAGLTAISLYLFRRMVRRVS